MIRIVQWLPLVAVLVIASVVPMALALGQAKSDSAPGEPVVVIFAPWVKAIPVVTAAGGRLVADGRLPSIAMVASDNLDFTDRLYGTGAWWVLSSNAAAILCGPRTRGPT